VEVYVSTRMSDEETESTVAARDAGFFSRLSVGKRSPLGLGGNIGVKEVPLNGREEILANARKRDSSALELDCFPLHRLL
jgi:hypothetical protein